MLESPPEAAREPSVYATMKPVVIVGTLFWDQVPGAFLGEWTQLFASFQESDWDAEMYMQVNGSSLLPHTRNEAVRQAILRRPHFTHLILVDSDMTGLYTPEVRRLVEHDVPIVGPICTHKVDPYNPTVWAGDSWEAVYEELDKENPGLVPRMWIGTGCVCLRRDVIDAMAIRCQAAGLNDKGDLDHGFTWFRTGRDLTVDWERRRNEAIAWGARRTCEILIEKGKTGEQIEPGDFAATHAEMFEQALAVFNDAQTSGEDLEFGLRALAKGFPSYVDCGIQLGHLGLRARGIPDHVKAQNVHIKRKLPPIRTNSRMIRNS